MMTDYLPNLGYGSKKKDFREAYNLINLAAIGKLYQNHRGP
jgi:hypothetical protein